MFSFLNSPSRKLYAYISFVLFVIAVAAIIISNIYLLNAAHPLPFYEPDNYEYLLFVHLALQQHTLNVSNPYLIHPESGFFEQPGLYQLPYFLSVLGGMSAIVSMHLIYAVFLILLYVLLLVIARRITHSILLNHFERYFIYAIILLSPLLLPYNYIIEWRGTLFIAVAGLAAILLLDFMMRASLWRHKAYYAVGVVGLAAFSVYMWSGGIVVPISIVCVCVGYAVYKTIPFRITMIGTLVATLGLIVLAFMPATLGPVMFPFLGSVCTSNSLHLAEAVCLDQTSSVGLVGVALLFSFIALLILISPRTIYNTAKKNEFLLVALFTAVIVQLPLVIVYFRLIAIVAPELAVLFSLGLVMLSKYFQTKPTIEFLVLGAVVIMLLFTMMSDSQGTATYYHIYNPVGLYESAAFLNSTYPGASVFTFFGYGDVLEAYGHVRTYSDTIQQLAYANTSLILEMQPQNACRALAALTPRPKFVLLAAQLANYSTYQNVSKSSLIYTQKAGCLTKIWQKNNFTLYNFT